MRRRDSLLLSGPVIAVGRTRSWVHRTRATRSPRPWLAMVAVPLAMVASMMSFLWWCWPPLIVVAWWFADRRWRWTWIVAVEAGVDGTLWAYTGATALGYFVDARLLVAAIWIGFALLLLAAFAYIRRNDRDLPPRFPGY